MSEMEDNAQTESNTATDSEQDATKAMTEKADTKRGTDTSSSHSDQEQEKEKDDHPAFSLATLGLQRVGTVAPPKPKAVQQPIQMLNARGMPARIRKRNRFFFDENIINDDKPLRMRLSPKKLPLKCSGSSAGATASTEQNDDSATSGVAGQPRTLRKTKVTPSKVLEKRKGVVSRYMRSEPVTSKIRKNASTKLKGSAKKTQQGKVLKIKTKPPPPTKRGKGKSATTDASTIDSSKAAASDTSIGSDDKLFAHKLIGQTIGLSLRNLLKLPKAHKWAIAEWFYSYIDKPLFEGDSEFENYIKDIYPGLQTRDLTRAEWRWIRRTMGKPRRCSQAFLDAERRELARKRMLLRTLQSRKPGDLKDLVLLSDMPDKIPMPLPVGTKVTARLRQPQDGIFSGSVDAYDSLNGMYRVTFERPGLGTHTISDFEIVSENFHEMLPLHTFIKDFRPNLISIFTGKRNHMPPQKQLVSNILNVRSALNIKLNKSDPLLGQEAFAASSPYKTQLTRYHGFPTKLLENIVRLQRTSNMKLAKVQRQSDMNDEAELLIANSATKFAIDDGSNISSHLNSPLPITGEFQRRYASNIIAIEKLNDDATYYLNEVLKLSVGLSPDPNVQAMMAPTFLREKCREVADKTVERLNNSHNPVKNTKIIKLIKNLAMLLILTSRIGADNKVAKVLDGCMEEVQTNLISRDNVEVFQNNVQLNLNELASIISKNALLTNSLSYKKTHTTDKLDEDKKHIEMNKNENMNDDDVKEASNKKENQNEEHITENEQDQKHQNDGIAPIDDQSPQSPQKDYDDDTISQNEEPEDQSSNTDVKSIEQNQVDEKGDKTIENKLHEDQDQENGNDLAPIEQGQVHETDDTTQSEHLEEDENMSSNEQEHVHETNEQKFQSQENDDMPTIGQDQGQGLVHETDDTIQIEHLEDQGDDDMARIEQDQEEEEPMIDDITHQNEQFEIQDDDIIETIEQGQLYDETDDTSQIEQIHVETVDDIMAQNDNDHQIQDNDEMEMLQSEQFQLKVDDDDDGDGTGTGDGGNGDDNVLDDDDDDIEMGEEEHLIETDEVNSNENIDDDLVEETVVVPM